MPSGCSDIKREFLFRQSDVHTVYCLSKGGLSFFQRASRSLESLKVFNENVIDREPVIPYVVSQ